MYVPIIIQYYKSRTTTTNNNNINISNISRKHVEYAPVLNEKEILEEIKKAFLNEQIKDSDNISLYDLASIIKTEYKKLEEIKKVNSEKLEEAYNIKTNSNRRILIHDFDYKNYEMSIGVSFFSDWPNIYFKKNNDTLYVSKSETILSDKLFPVLFKELNSCYDEFMEYEYYYKQQCLINAINSDFLININHYGVKILDKNSNFNLSSYAFSEEYDYQFDSDLIMDTLKENEDLLFKKLFVKIEDCPKWSREKLYKFRINQLEEERIYEEKQRILELQRQEDLRKIEEKRVRKEKILRPIKRLFER